MHTHPDPLPALASFSPERLASLAALGDRNAMSELYERYYARSFRFLHHRVTSYQTAEDLNGEAWLRILKNIGAFQERGDGSFCAWMFSILRRLVIDHYRGRKAPLLTADMLTLDLASTDLGPDGEALRRAEAREVVSAVAGLRASQRECIVLRFYQGLTVAETAQVMGRSEGAVKLLQHRATRVIATTLRSSGDVLSYQTAPAAPKGTTDRIVAEVDSDA